MKVLYDIGSIDRFVNTLFAWSEFFPGIFNLNLDTFSLTILQVLYVNDIRTL